MKSLYNTFPINKWNYPVITTNLDITSIRDMNCEHVSIIKSNTEEHWNYNNLTINEDIIAHRSYDWIIKYGIVGLILFGTWEVILQLKTKRGHM